MEKSQIVRFPKKYRDLISSLSNDEAGKLFKKILGEEIELSGNLGIYFGFINSDLENLEKSAINGGKGGRPQSNKDKITTGYGKEKPQVIESDNLKGSREEEEEKVEGEVEKELEDKVDISSEITQIIEYWNNELGNKYEVTDDLKEIYKKVRKKNDMQIVENTTVFYIDKCKKMEKQYHLSPFKFFKQSNGFITYKNSIC